MRKKDLLELLVGLSWDIATKAREGADPREVEFLLEELEQQLSKALGLTGKLTRGS